MTLRKTLSQIVQQEDLNFLLTNRIPRQCLTRFVGWLSRIEQPLVRDLSIGIWKLFSDLDLSEAKHTRFKSMQECFTRQLKEGARPIDPEPTLLTSPCDAIVGACGYVQDATLFQAKGFPYALRDLLIDPALAERYRNGTYVTLRLTSSMYHRFHAPYACRVSRVTYISGDTWNVNPIALERIEKLFCKNERALIEMHLHGTEQVITLVPVAAILVASIRLHFLDVLLHLQYRGPNRIECDARCDKGEELGWFQHGSTIILFAPPGFRLCDGVAQGARIRMGERLMHLPAE